MKKNLFLKVLIALIFLTALSAFISSNTIETSYVAAIIIIFSILKFMGVSFYFMELKKAHVFWKSSILFFVVIFAIITIILL